jgi:hypothetical protein
MARAPVTEIYFRCTACRRRLAIGASGAGHLVECPSCSASLQVPQASTILAPDRLRLVWITGSTALGLALLAGAGWRLWQQPAPTSMEPNRVVAAAARQAASGPGHAAEVKAGALAPDVARLQVLEKENRELLAASRASGKQYEELANWVLKNMRGRFPLKDQFVSKLKFSPLTEEFAVHPDVADFLDLNENEQGLLNDAFAYGRSSLAEIESAFITVTQASPDRVTLHIPPFEKEGGALRDDLYGALESVLGRPRFDRLIDVSEEELAKNYHYFGAAARTMIFQLTESENPKDPPYLVIKDGWIIPSGQDRRTIQATESAVRELPATYASYLAWLPDFVAAYLAQ